MHEALLLMKFLQTRPQIRNRIINCYDLFYTIIKSLTEEEKNEVSLQNF